ncbi:MAG: calcium-binding protein [Litoreibacter sp.]
MHNYILDLNQASSVSAEITQHHFGANYVYNFEHFGDEPWAKYDEVIADIGLTNIRYPGGNGAEVSFDFTNPNSTTNLIGQDVTPMDEFIQFVGTNDLDATLIMPTRPFLPGESHDFLTYSSSEQKWVVDNTKLAMAKGDIETFVRTIMQEALDSGARIYAIQLGNEYPGVRWTNSAGDVTTMTAKQYGQIANELAKITQETIDQFNADINAGRQDPQIVVQVLGDYNQGGLSSEHIAAANEAVLAQFDTEGLDAIDAVSSHLYFKELKSNSVGEFHSYETLSQKIIDLVTSTDIWDAATGKDLDVMISEWNVQKFSFYDPGFEYWENNDRWDVSQDWLDHSYFGLKQVAPMLEIFSSFLKTGVNSAHAWSVMYSSSALSTHFNGGQLYAAGGLLKILQTNLIGTSYVEMDWQSEELDIHVFEGRDAGHVFVTSLGMGEQTVSLDLQEFSSNLDTITLKYLRADYANADGEFTVNGTTYVLPSADHAYVEADLSLLIETGAVVLDGTKLIITLNSYETAYVTFDTDGRITTPTGSVRADNKIGENAVLVDAEFDNADPFSIFGDADGALGDIQYDTQGWVERSGEITGSSDGTTTSLFAGNSSQEKLFGSADADTILGTSNGDVIWGNENNDVLDGLAGNDVLTGGQGNDELIGGSGDDRLFGSDGNDQLAGGSGNDILKGGIGRDTFIFNTRFGHDVISDFDVVRDQITFQDAETLGVQDVAQLIRNYAQQENDNVVIEFDSRSSITIHDLTLSAFEDVDILLL